MVLLRLGLINKPARLLYILYMFYVELLLQLTRQLHTTSHTISIAAFIHNRGDCNCEKIVEVQLIPPKPRFYIGNGDEGVGGGAILTM